MAGSLFWNLTFSIIAFLLSFTFSIISNTLNTSMVRAAAAFFILFLFTFLFRLLAGFVKKSQRPIKRIKEDTEEKTDHFSEGNQYKDLANAKAASETIRSLLNE
ncbi:hypothetical protein [Thalassobacillus pellis]|uniref:hypothetical protein n=1 Tax=Thalassobacillus pellis TaxID=748008 RepID=UPI00195F755F|nr:hypothetical protein [Thalassobacillus pellis]MBM7552725.1 hypothetical protein [Thalassobacillus pellis]